MCTQLLVLHMHNEVLLKRSLDLLFTWSYSQAPTQPSIAHLVLFPGPNSAFHCSPGLILRPQLSLPLFTLQNPTPSYRATSDRKLGGARQQAYFLAKTITPGERYTITLRMSMSWWAWCWHLWVVESAKHRCTTPPPPPPPHPQPKRDTTIILGICCNILGWAWTPDKACYGAIHETHSIDFNTRK